MPCYDPRDNEDRKLTKKRLDLATRVACELAKALKDLETGEKSRVYLSAETKAWIREHSALDEARTR